MLAGRIDGERMKVRANSKPEGADGCGDRHVQGRASGWLVPPPELVHDMRSVTDRAHGPGAQAPRLHVSRRDGKQNSDEGVADADENRRTYP